MFHRKMAIELRRVLRARFHNRPFSRLDLGCGDAAALAPVLEGLQLQRYKGVDLSQTALALAVKNLSALSCPMELVHGEISAALTEDTASYDAIYCSFVLHHLPTANKAEFFHRAARCLAGSGLLLLVDVVREEDESLDAYYRHYRSWLRSTFSALHAQEQEFVCDHIVHNDLPEPATVLKAQALAAGLSRARQIARYNWHHALSFTRA
jgi:ubiquinone/menaquinone biosynthesis C-methylase UbiE